MKIFLLAHSGGNVWEYKKLFSEIEEHQMIPIELPGNLSKWNSVLPDSLEEYAEICVSFIRNHTDEGEKIGIFGHSFGAYLIYEIAARMPDMVEKVVLSGCTPFHEFELPSKVDSYNRYFGYSDEVNEEIDHLFHHVISHKLSLIEAYCTKVKDHQTELPIDIASCIITANDDIASKDPMGWSRYLNPDKMEIIRVEGGHFYWKNNECSKQKMLAVLKLI